METGRASRTALGVANRRAVHQVLDRPPVLNDPIAVPILGPQFEIDHERQKHPAARAFRAFMAVRSRYAEDNLATAVASGLTQYVSPRRRASTPSPIGNPFPQLRVFGKSTFPATQRMEARPASMQRKHSRAGKPHVKVLALATSSTAPLSRRPR